MLVDDRQPVGGRLAEPGDHLVQRGGVGERGRQRLHRVGDAQQLHQVGAAAAHDVDPAAAQLQRVDRVVAEHVGDTCGEHDREHQRQDDPVVAGELEDDDHRGDRRARRTGEDRAHADDPVGAGRAGHCPAAGGGHRSPYALPSIAPMNSEGAKTPPEPPIAIVRLVARILPASRASRSQRA